MLNLGRWRSFRDSPLPGVRNGLGQKLGVVAATFLVGCRFLLKIDSVKSLQDEEGTLASFRPGVLNRIDGSYGKLLRLKARPGASQ